MFNVSEVITKEPDHYKTPLHEMVFETLSTLQIPFERVDTAEAFTMEDCFEINEKLDMKMVKSLFLCNSKKTDFYLFVTTADKPFKSKDFSNALGISRVSFAPAELMESMLGTKVGAATIFGVLLDKDNRVLVVLDEDILSEEWYGCTDGTNTGYIKVNTKQVVHHFLTFAKHIPTVIRV